MATSGSFETRVPSSNGFIFRLEWSLASQNITNNTSTINVTLRWIAPSGWIINASVSRPGSVTAAGTTSTFSHNASLTSGQNRILWSGSRTVTHNANGTGSFSLSATWAPQVTLSGVWVHTVSLASRSFTLPTIARASTINANPSWTALTGSLTTQITRASTAFSHSIRLQVRNSGDNAWVNIGDWRHFTGTAHTFNLSQPEFTTLFTTLAGRTSAPSRVELITRNGSTATSAQVGSTVTRDGTVTAPNATTVTGSDFTVAGNATAQTMTVSVNRAHTALVSDIQVRRGTTGLQTFTNQGAPASLLLDATGLANLRNQLTAGVTSLTNINFQVTTRYQNGGPIIRSATVSANFSATFLNINPTLSGNPTYSDTLGVTTAVTGNHQWIIQNRSQLTVVIPANFASANQGATVSNYEIVIGNRTEIRAFQTAQLTVALNVVNITGPTNLSIRALDSRGNSSTQTLTVQGVSYAEPIVNANAFRNDGFANASTLTLNGTLSPITVNGVHRNTVNQTNGVQRRQRIVGGTWSDWTNWPSTLSNDRTSVSTVDMTNHNLDNEQAWEIEFRISDALSTTTVMRTVSVGAPTLFIDPFRSAVSINGMPTAANQLSVNGTILESGQRLIRRSRLVPEQANLNDSQWREEGNYHNSTNAQTQTIANRPPGMNTAFSMSVHRHSANHSEGCHQVVRSFSTNLIYIRSMTYEGIWSAWSEISRISNGNLDNGHTRMTSTWIGTHNNNQFSIRQNNINRLNLLGDHTDIMTIGNGEIRIFNSDSQRRDIRARNFIVGDDASHTAVHRGQFRFRQGEVAVTPPSGGGTASVIISYGETFPNNNVSLQVSLATSVPGTTVTGVGFNYENLNRAQQARIFVNRTNSTNTWVHWLAVWRG